MEFWQQKIVATKNHGAVCFSCKNDFEYSALDTIALMVTGHSFEAMSHAMKHFNDGAPGVDKNGGATFTYATQPIFEAIRYLITVMGNALNMPPPIAKFYLWVMRWTPTYKKHHEFAFDQLKK